MDTLPLSLEGRRAAADSETAPAEIGPLDRSRFADLYECNLPGIYSYIRARTVRDEDAVDLAHQVFVQALEALPRYRNRGIPHRAWLYRIAHNAVIDFRRRTHPNVSWESVPQALELRDEEEVERAVLQREQAVRIQQLLGSVDEDKREVLALRFAGGLKVREIAEVLDRSESAVKTEIRRTLRLLREHYDDD